MSRFRKDLVGVFVLLAASCCVAWIVNAAREDTLPWWGGPGAMESREFSGVSKQISLKELQVRVEQGKGLILDVRPESLFREGHIPGALSLPYEDFDNAYERLKGRLAKEAMVVLYCGSRSCRDSEQVYQRLKALGHTRLLIFRGGWQVWAQTGQRIETGDPSREAF